MKNNFSTLGRTINDLVEENQMSEKLSEEIVEVDLMKIDPNPDQPRTLFDKDALQELSISIKEHGVIQPVILKEGASGRYTLVAGERRVKASIMAGLKTVPGIIRDYNSIYLSEIAMLENIQREDLTPIEEAIALQNALSKLSLTHDQLSKKIGKSRSYVTNLIGLLQLPEYMVHSMNIGDITMGHARVLSKIKDKDLRDLYYHRILDETLTVRELELIVRESSKKTDVYIISKNEALKVENDLKEYVPKNIDFNVKKNKIEFSFSTKKELKKILSLIKGDKDE